MTERRRQSLDGQWLFWPDPMETLTPAHLPADKARQITVPGPWQAQFEDLRSDSGPAWYYRLFELPAGWRTDCLILGFDAVDYRAEVWLNGEKVGEHEGGYLPFELDVTAAARPGENELVVRVSDPPELFPEIPHGKQSWYGPLSGIWQPVWLESRSLKHIRQVKITPEAATGQVLLAVTSNLPLAVADRIEAVLFSPDGRIVAETTVTTPDFTLVVDKPQLWDVESPHLYTARIRLKTEAGADTITETFGFRTIEARAGKLWLNGRPLYLRGALDQDYYPDLIYTPPSYEYIEQQFRQAKAMGLNCLRIHIKVADPRYYEAADRVGLLIWTELPNWVQLTAEAKARGRKTIAGMLQRDWNHPSIIIWTIINEAWGTELATNPDHRTWLNQMFAWVKQLDPTRLVVDNSPCFPNAHVNSDLDDFHYYAAMPDGMARWDEWVEAMANRAEWLYAPEYQANGSSSAPLIVSEFGNWGLPDIGPLLAHYGGEPWWFETGWEWSGGDVYPHAVERRFDALYLQKVFGDYAGLARASQWAQFEALRYEIETMRLYPQITGYVITEWTDLHWECNGLLDMLRQPKVYAGRLAEINADTMVIPRPARRAWTGGETAVIPFHLSHVGPQPVREAVLNWSLSGDGVPAVAGRLDPVSCRSPEVVALPPLSVPLPVVSRPTRILLGLTVVDGEGQTIARNELPLLVLPETAISQRLVACSDKKLAAALRKAGYDVTTDLSPDVPLIATNFEATNRRFVEQGGRVLFLAETAEALQTAVPRLSLQARQGTPWAGDWASSFAWYRRDLWGSDLPGDGRFDFTFSAVLPQTVITSTSPLDFREEVLAGLFVGWLRRPVGLVQKLPVGEGTLLVSTLRLRDNLDVEPIAVKLMNELLALL
jgi:hypothetical protein